jgi:alginate O-acetyltransferase complex protein AlgI
MLLLASCYFYMVFKPVYILILAFTITVDYFAGVWIEKSEGKQRKYLLIASIVANVGVLAIFKYYNFPKPFLAGFARGYRNRPAGAAIPYLASSDWAFISHISITQLHNRGL